MGSKHCNTDEKVCRIQGYFYWKINLVWLHFMRVSWGLWTSQITHTKIVAGVLQGDTSAPYQFIICLDYVLRTSIDSMKENGFKLTKERSRRYPARTIMDADYIDDITLLANTPAQAESRLHSLELAASDIGLHVNTDKTVFLCFNQQGYISTLNGRSLNLVHLPWKHRFIYWKWHEHATSEGIESYW